LKNYNEKNIPFLKGFGQIAFDFIIAVFKSRWDQLRIDSNNKTFQKLIKDEFTIKVSFFNKGKKTNSLTLTKLANFSKF